MKTIHSERTMGKPHPPKSSTPKAHKKSPDVAHRDEHPPPEEDFGGGDIASPEVCPSTEDDKPLE